MNRKKYVYLVYNQFDHVVAICHSAAKAREVIRGLRIPVIGFYGIIHFPFDESIVGSSFDKCLLTCYNLKKR